MRDTNISIVCTLVIAIITAFIGFTSIYEIFTNKTIKSTSGEIIYVRGVDIQQYAEEIIQFANDLIKSSSNSNEYIKAEKLEFTDNTQVLNNYPYKVKSFEAIIAYSIKKDCLKDNILKFENPLIFANLIDDEKVINSENLHIHKKGEELRVPITLYFKADNGSSFWSAVMIDNEFGSKKTMMKLSDGIKYKIKRSINH